jgi:hypothetical protein
VIAFDNNPRAEGSTRCDEFLPVDVRNPPTRLRIGVDKSVAALVGLMTPMRTGRSILQAVILGDGSRRDPPRRSARSRASAGDSPLDIGGAPFTL